MPINDYNKKKDLEVTTQNDSGTTQDKAQAILIRGEEEFKEQDEFEDGNISSNPAWTIEDSDAIATVQDNTILSGQKSLKLDSDPGGGLQGVVHDRGSNDSVSDGDVYTCLINTGNTNFAEYELYNSGEADLVKASFDNGNIVIETSQDNGKTIGSYQSNTLYRVELKLFPSKSEAVLTVKNSSDDVVAKGTTLNGTTGASNLQFVRLFGGGPVYFDDVSYNTNTVNFGTKKESDTGTGDIVIDFSNIAGPEDIAVFDQNGNLLDYEIEKLDTTTETGVIWVYNSWTRDDTVQAQIAYGDNSTNTNRQNVIGTWNKTGQNADLIQHFEESNFQLQDSSPNGYDSVSNTGTTFLSSSQFDGARKFDGVDDVIDYGDKPEFSVLTSGTKSTLVLWFKDNNFDGDNVASKYVQKGRKGGIGEWAFHPQSQANGNNKFAPRFDIFGDNNLDEVSDTLDTGEYYCWIMTIEAGTKLETFIDGVSEGVTFSNVISADGGEELSMGATPGGSGPANVEISEFKLYNGERKSSDWIQAEYDASPKAGQVYFSQEAAETIGPQTVSAPTTSVTFSNPEPQVNPQTATIQAPETNVAVNNPEPQVQATGSTSVNAQTTTLTVSNPEPIITTSLIIEAPTTEVSVSNPEPEVQGTGSTDINAAATQITVTNPEPEVQGTGIVDIQAPETNVDVTNADPQIQPTGNATIQAPETSINIFNPEPTVLLRDITVLQPTFALLTNTNRFVDMEQQTFKKNDFSDAVTATLKDENGVIDLSNAVQEVRLLMQTTNGTQKLDEKVSITDAVNGKVRYKWSQGDPIEEVGVYKAEFEIIDGSGDSETVPNNDYISLTVQEDLT